MTDDETFLRENAIREGAWVTLELRNLFVGDVGPIFFREKIKLPSNLSSTEAANFIRNYARDLGERQAKFFESKTPQEIQESLDELDRQDFR